ncbi:hypothetical protein INT50_18785 [Vibrio diabolicus]|uniref:hypothetical protein n=1 Tax=Vibrio diabolicus TaxID=50719 RepID=UPI0013E04304|nr:hypothetical protein [Vibrio diabolicus]QOV32863.1 hypothetical protein INT50_18785 [Vibrio diabolicus]
MSYISIPANESGLPFALEQYYKELSALIGVRDDQPILLNNTITTFDIVKDAPFYTEGVFRNYSDRKYKLSPRDIGSAVETDRFSFEYERILGIASTQIDGTISEETRLRIENLKREIRRVSRDLVDFEKVVLSNWEEIVESEGISPETPRYELRRINYLESILYADQKKQYSEEIEDYQRSINNLRESAYSPAQQKLLRAADELSETYKVARPWNIYFERDFPDSNILTFADPTVRSRQFCDVSPAIYPANNLVLFQERGGEARNISVTENTQHNELHKRTWGASGSAGFSCFGLRFGGGGGGSGSSSYKRDFESLKSFSLDFKGIEEVYANRGLWYDPTLFSSEELKPIFDKIPGARDLEYVGVSLIIAKGLTLSLSFDETVETESWTRRRFNGRGGVSVFGYKFGGSGSRTSYDYDFKLSEDKKTVTFTDDPEHCRLLGVRLEKIYHPPQTEEQGVGS